MMAPQDEALFRAFQSNLLSLVSHELRTPLAGILNALEALGEGIELPGMSNAELIQMARQNAHRLQYSLEALLDLAALESGTFHTRLREVDLVRLVQGRMEAQRSLFKKQQVSCEWDSKSLLTLSPVLADPQKLGRAVDLCFQALVPRAESESQIKVHVIANQIQITFQLSKDKESQWESSCSQALVGFQGGVSSPFSAFSGVMQSEEAFLTRDEEGLGSEFLLIHEIMRVHGGRLEVSRLPRIKDRRVTLSLELPELSSEEGLRTVLSSRAFQISTELGSVGLILIPVPEAYTVEGFRDELKKCLFRTTDAAYPLPERRQVALVLDDCKAEDASRLVTRIGLVLSRDLHFGTAHCPSDGLDPGILLKLAEIRLELALRNNP